MSQVQSTMELGLVSSIHHELEHSARYSFWPKYTYAIKQEGCLNLEMLQQCKQTHY